MPVSDKPSAYGPILRAMLNAAATSTAGISLEVSSQNEGIATRQRLYKVRELENRNIRKNLGPEFSGPWDAIRILVESKAGIYPTDPEKWFVILTKDDILLGQAKITDLATGRQLGVAGDLLKAETLAATSTIKDPFGEEEE